MKLSECIAKTIDLANAYDQAKYYPRWEAFSLPVVQEKKDLQSFLDSLPAKYVFLILMVMYLGRGDYDTHDLQQSYDSLVKTFQKRPDWAINQMIGKDPLAQYLSSGLERLRMDNIDVDTLMEEI